MTHQIEVTEYAGLPVVRASGELDVLAAPDLRGVLGSCPGPNQCHVVLDLGDATFIDSSVLGILVGALRRARDRGGELWLVTSRPAILTVLRVTNLDRVMCVRPTLDDAAGDILAGAGATGQGG